MALDSVRATTTGTPPQFFTSALPEPTGVFVALSVLRESLRFLQAYSFGTEDHEEYIITRKKYLDS